MNRDFFLRRLTPAKARMLMMASKCGHVITSPDIERVAKTDMMTDISLDRPIDPETLGICQFIKDYNHRCVLPFDYGLESIRDAIMVMMPSDCGVIFICDSSNIWEQVIGTRISAFSEKNTDRFQWLRVEDVRPDQMMHARDRYVIANITPTHIGYEWIGRLFSQIIIYCSQSAQYNLPLFGGLMSGQTTAARHAAAILYPQIVQSLGEDRNLKTHGDAALPLMGCYNQLLNKKPFLK